MKPHQLMCPYCNQQLLNYTAPNFYAPCCGKLVGVKEVPTFDVNVFIPVHLPPSCEDVDANKSIPGLTVRDANRDRSSRWTHIYWDSDWYVRLIGGYDLEDAGHPHGISVSPKFSTQKEARDYADRLDKIFDLIKETTLKKEEEES